MHMWRLCFENRKEKQKKIAGATTIINDCIKNCEFFIEHI